MAHSKSDRNSRFELCRQKATRSTAPVGFTGFPKSYYSYTIALSLYGRIASRSVFRFLRRYLTPHLRRLEAPFFPRPPLGWTGWKRIKGGFFQSLHPVSLVKFFLGGGRIAPIALLKMTANIQFRNK